MNFDLNDGGGTKREGGIGEAVRENEFAGEVGVNPALEAVEAHLLRHSIVRFQGFAWKVSLHFCFFVSRAFV